MKNLVLSLAIVALSASVFAADLISDTEVSAMREFILVQSKLDPIHMRGSFKMTGGNLRIGQKSVELGIYFKSNCPPDVMCIAMMPAPIMLNLPIVKIDRSACVTTITAKRDGRLVDGALQLIEIQDYTQSVCEIWVPYPVVVRYTTSYINRENGNDVTGTSSLGFVKKDDAFIDEN